MLSLMKPVSSEQRASEEQQLVLGLLMNDEFLERCSVIHDLRELIASSQARTVSEWCLEYYEKYKHAPREMISDLYQGYASQGQYDEAQLSLIQSMLSSIEKKFSEEQNWEYLLDKSIAYLRKRRMENLRERLTTSLVNEDLDLGDSFISDYNKVELHDEGAVGFSLIKDGERVRQIFLKDDDDEVARLPGVLGHMVGPMCRGDLVAFASPAKRGKSWWLQETAIRAMMARKAVVFYSLEMNDRQMMLRIAQSLCSECRPLHEGQSIDVQIPFFQGREIKHKTEKRYGLTLDQLESKRSKLSAHVGRGDIHLACYPAYSAGVKTLRLHLDRLEREHDIIPDVIVVDYADILAPEIKGDPRHMIDSVWKGLRALAQERHCLVVTASHTNKSTFSGDMRQSDMSEDIRKINHVSTMIGFNQTGKEKTLGVMRAVVLAQRHGEFNPDVNVVVLGNLHIGKPYLSSAWRKDVDYMEHDDKKKKVEEDD